MKRSGTSIAIRLLPSLGDFAFLMPVVFLFARLNGLSHLLSDGDTGWHIRTGDWILANGRVPTSDMFSFTMPGKPWFAWEWLWDVAFAWLHQVGGLAAVSLASILVLSFTCWLLYRLAARHSNPLIAFCLSSVAMIASSIHWLARPHLFSLLFTVIFLDILEKAAEGRTRLLWVLPPLTALWTNVHGAFFVGLTVVAGYAAGEAADATLAPSAGERRLAVRRGWRYCGVIGACLGATLVNPYGWRLHLHIVQFLKDPAHTQNIQEYFSLNFHHIVGPFFEFLLLAGAAAAVWHWREGRRRVGVLTVLWAHGALLAVRNIPIFVIVVVPFIAWAAERGCRQLAGSAAAAWLRKTAERFVQAGARTAEMEARGNWKLASAAGIAAAAVLMFAPAPPAKFRPVYDEKRYPEAALRQIDFGADARIFTDDEWGDYLIYRLYPKNRVFVDGRADFYGKKFGEDFMAIVRVRYDWEPKLEQYGVNAILLPTEASLAGALKQSRRWRVIYDDGIALVFRSADAAQHVAQRVSTAPGGGKGRDREITKTEARDQPITDIRPKTTT